MNNKKDLSSKKKCSYSLTVCHDFHLYVHGISEELNQTFVKMYCHGNFSKCARFFVHTKVGKEHLPVDVFPNQEIRAHSIVQEVQKIYS